MTSRYWCDRCGKEIDWVTMRDSLDYFHNELCKKCSKELRKVIRDFIKGGKT